MPYCVIDLIEEIVMIVAGVLLVTNMTSVLDGAQRAAFAIIISYLFSFSISFVYFFVKGGRLKNPRSQFKPLLHSALPITGMRTSNSLINSVISLLLPARLIAAGFTSQQAMSELGVAMGMSMPILSIPATLIGSLSLVIVPEPVSYTHLSSVPSRSPSRIAAKSSASRMGGFTFVFASKEVITSSVKVK